MKAKLLKKYKKKTWKYKMNNLLFSKIKTINNKILKIFRINN